MKSNAQTEPEIADSNMPWTGALPTALHGLLHAELSAGNAIQYVAGTGREADTCLLVLLEKPFQNKPAQLPPDVQFHQVDDPDWWAAEYVTAGPTCVLACTANAA